MNFFIDTDDSLTQGGRKTLMGFGKYIPLGGESVPQNGETLMVIT
jgi:hypothetical protein